MDAGRSSDWTYPFDHVANSQHRLLEQICIGTELEEVTVGGAPMLAYRIKVNGHDGADELRPRGLKPC